MNCGANVLVELFRLVVVYGRRCDGIEGEDPEGENDWFLEWLGFWVGGELSIIDLGRAAASACEEGIEEGIEEGDGEPLLKGFRRKEEPLSVLVVIMKTRGQNFPECGLAVQASLDHSSSFGESLPGQPDITV